MQSVFPSDSTPPLIIDLRPLTRWSRFFTSPSAKKTPWRDRVVHSTRRSWNIELDHDQRPNPPRVVVSVISLELWNKQDEDENGDDMPEVDHDESDRMSAFKETNSR